MHLIVPVFSTLLYSRMYSLGLAKMAQSGNLVPKQYLYQVFVQFETLAKNQNFYLKVEPQYEKPLNMKPTARCDLPLGSKRGSFMSRSPSVMPQKTVRSSAVTTKWKQLEPLHLLQQLEKEDLIIEKVQLFKKCPPSQVCDHSKAKCTSQDSPDPRKQNKRGPNMEMVAYQLTQDLANIFMQRQDWSIYHKKMVLQDNIRGQCITACKMCSYHFCFRGQDGWPGEVHRVGQHLEDVGPHQVCVCQDVHPLSD